MVRFDTLDKKPKLYNIAIVTGAAVVLSLILYLTQILNWSTYTGAVYVAAIAVDLLLLIRAFLRQLRYNPYSYNTIYYFGFALYLLFILVTVIEVLAVLLKMPELEEGQLVLYTLSYSPRRYMLITSPVILALSVALVISNISLIRHEGFRVVNILGIVLAFLLTGGVVFLFFADYYVTGSFGFVLAHDLFMSVFSSVYLYFECMVLGSIVANAIVSRYEPDKDKDFIIILGCGIRKDGTPTPLLEGRIRRALKFYQSQLETTGKAACFITSGGQGSDECISESACMKNYLLAEGIPESQIIMEDQSSTTQENMKFSKEKIDAIAPVSKVIFSTTNYHVFRSGLFARRIRMKAQGIGAKTKWYFWPNAAVRELASMLTHHKGKQIVTLLCIIVVYVLLVLFDYEIF